MNAILCLLAPLLLVSSGLRAAPPQADDAAFLRDMSRLQLQPIRQAVQDIGERQMYDRFWRRITAKLSWYGEAERQAGLGAEQIARIAADGVRRGVYDSVVIGESHNSAQEQEAARVVISGILGSGARVGAFLEEAVNVAGGAPEGLFPAVGQLAAAQVPIRLMRNQFNPDPDVAAGLKVAGNDILITYSGTNHTSALVRDYSIDTLQDSDLGWGQDYPGRPVIEQSLRNRGRKPLVLAMIKESYVFDRILGAGLNEASNNVPLGLWKSNLASLQAAWQRAAAEFQAGAATRFIPVSGKPDFYVGITSESRRPLQVESLRRVAAMPDLARWLGNDKIKAVSACMFSSEPCPPGTPCCLGYEITVDKGGPDKFHSTVCAEDL